jgi:hypothetical protein
MIEVASGGSPFSDQPKYYHCSIPTIPIAILMFDGYILVKHLVTMFHGVETINQYIPRYAISHGLNHVKSH